MSCLHRLILAALLCASLASAAHADVVDVPAMRDAQVVQGYTSSNYGSATNMYVASDASGSYKNERSWMRFNLQDNLPAGATINSAKLRVYCWKSDAANSLETVAYGSTNTSWDEAALTWSTQPTLDTELGHATLQANATGVWYEWDVTSFVAARQSADKLVSLAVKAVAESQTPGRSYAFDTRDFSGSLAPRLRIDYTGQWPTGEGYTILHMNDTHARLTPHELDYPSHDATGEMVSAGGAAYFAAEMLALKQANPDALVLDAGDISEGNPVGDLRGNGGMVEFFNTLDQKLKAQGGRGIDAMTVGNHDIRNMEYLTNMKTKTSFPVVSMNVCLKGTHTPYFQAYTIVEIGGRKVGILGFTHDGETSPDPQFNATLDIVKCAWDNKGDSSIISVRDYVKKLRDDEGCDMVVLISHIGQTRTVAGTDALLVDDGEVKLPEVVVHGHWHSWCETAWQPGQLNGKTLLVEAASYMQYVGELKVTDSGKYVSATKHAIRDAEITPDVTVQALVDRLITEYNTTYPGQPLNEVIGYSAVDLRLDKGKWWTMDEYPWNGDNTAGGWICDAMTWKGAQLGAPCDLAIQSGGGVRRDVPAGPVTYTQIYETYPWAEDSMVRVDMTGQAIWNFIEGDYCDAALSKGWLVTAHNGKITSIKYNGTEISKTATYHVAISNYMQENDSSLVFTNPVALGYSIRSAMVDYTRQFTQGSPLTVPGPRYNLDTQVAGGFRAVITMMDDAESQPYYESGFVRLLGALPDTMAHRSGYGLSELVNADGTINASHKFAETMVYRSQLGWVDGKYKPGDIVEIYCEGGFHNGTPECIEQEGVTGPETEIKVVGHDESLARPEFFDSISGFWDDAHINHYVVFYARKTGASSVQDSSGQSISVYQPGGYYAATLPGAVGDVLKITGVTTANDADRIFRVSGATVASGFPPHSAVTAISPAVQTTTPLTLTATAANVPPLSSATVQLPASADAQVVSGYPTSNYGGQTSLYVQSAASGSYKNERSWLKFGLSQVPAGATITGARLKLYCWKATGGNMAASVYSGDSDSWTETGLTWNSQPTFSGPLSTQTMTSGTTGVWYSWDVTSYVQSKLTAGASQLSLLVRPQTEGSATTLTYAFESKEWTSGQPVLEVDYEATPVTTGVSKVEYFYRYSADNAAWGNWTSAGSSTTTDTWAKTFGYPSGYGYYQFYSLATDTNNLVELQPLAADATVRYTSLPPVSPTATGSVTPGATDVSTSPTLAVTVSDPDSSSLTVSFYGRKAGGTFALIGTATVNSGSTASVTWPSLQAGSGYEWYAVVSDGVTPVQSQPYVFNTQAAVAQVPALDEVGLILAMGGLLLLGRASLRRLQ